MSERWAARLDCADARAVGPLRLRPGLEVLEQEGALWLRGEGTDDALDLALRKIPGAERFEVLPDGVLRPIGRRVPRGRLPDGAWVPLRGWLVLEPQTGALAATTDAPAELRVVRSAATAEANVLLLPLAAWADWVLQAPEVRLRPLDFAADRQGRTVVRGTPLPSLAGERWVERSGVAVPCGYEWVPALEAPALRAWLRLESGDLALLGRDGAVDVVPAASFVRARRTAVRATVEEGLRG